jgi:hypothetical protein
VTDKVLISLAREEAGVRRDAGRAGLMRTCSELNRLEGGRPMGIECSG